MSLALIQGMKASIKDLILILGLLTLFSVNAFSAIPPEQTNLNIHAYIELAAPSRITNSDVAAIIPTDIPEGASEGTVSKMVLDKALKSALKSDYVRSSSVAQTADSLKDGINTEMAIGGDSNDPDAVQHKFKMKLDPIQTRARIQYSGFFNASASFDKGDSKVEIHENFDKYQLNLVHQVNDIEALSIVQLQFNW